MSQILRQNDWQALYRETLLESDSTRLPVLIEQAHRAVLSRALELWYSGSQATKELDELDAALYFLSLLKELRSSKDLVPDRSDEGTVKLIEKQQQQINLQQSRPRSPGLA